MAVRCFCLEFRPSDHVFLHKSHVFSNISKILSKSDEGWGLNTIARERRQEGTSVTSLHDLTRDIDIKTSSRQMMASSLTGDVSYPVTCLCYYVTSLCVVCRQQHGDVLGEWRRRSRQDQVPHADVQG